MWALENHTPFAAQRACLADIHGAKVWVVVVRGTFHIPEQGPPVKAVQQQPVILAPEYLGEPGQSDLRHDTDLVPTKSTTDVLVLAGENGSHKPAALRVQQGEAVLVDKEVPHGPGSAPEQGNEHDLAPAGLGPLSPMSPPRLEHAGTYDETWRQERFPLLPLDFDPRFYLCAPADQQPGAHLQGGEAVVVKTVNPESQQEFTLPLVPLSFRSLFGQDWERHQARVYTVVIEPAERRLQMVWQTHLACHDRIHKLLKTVISLDDGEGAPS